MNAISRGFISPKKKESEREKGRGGRRKNRETENVV